MKTTNKYITINPTPSISFLGLLTILFIGLKLTNYISWSWAWVLAPIWIPASIILTIIITIIAGIIMVAGISFYIGR